VATLGSHRRSTRYRVGCDLSLRLDPSKLRGDDESLEEISWDSFFKGFEDNGLAFVYQEETAEGQESRFSKLVSR
jgi:hypothetical protein